MTKSDVVRDVLWTEKYRPQSLSDLALEPETRQLLQSYLDAGEIPHLLLIGPAGSGKTTVARIITNTIDCSTLTLNASSERGIDTVRAKIGSFVTAITGATWNTVFLDEGDAMTSDAQTALRNLMESYSERARFIITANYGHKIIAPIQSRCQVITMGRPQLKERYRILVKVLQAEGVEVQPNVALGWAERNPDMRQMLMAVQKAILGSKTRTLGPVSTSGAVDGPTMFQMLQNKDWTGFRGLTTSGDFDIQQALRELFWAIPDSHPKAGYLRHTVARGVHETGFTPDPIILFLGIVSETMERL